MSTDQDDAIPREQLETALRTLEEFHGQSLRRPWSNEAVAYYHAIDMVEAALNEELKDPEDVFMRDWQWEYVKASREAREEGYREATCLDDRQMHASDNTQSPFDRLLDFARGLIS